MRPETVRDLRITFLLWLPLYAAVMTHAALAGFDALWLFAVAMGLATWSLAEAVVLVVRHVAACARRRRIPPEPAEPGDAP